MLRIYQFHTYHWLRIICCLVYIILSLFSLSLHTYHSSSPQTPQKKCCRFYLLFTWIIRFLCFFLTFILMIPCVFYTSSWLNSGNRVICGRCLQYVRYQRQVLDRCDYTCPYFWHRPSVPPSWLPRLCGQAWLVYLCEVTGASFFLMLLSTTKITITNNVVRC